MLKVLVFVVSLALVSSEKNTTQVVLEWNYINYTWPSRELYISSVDDGSYVKENNGLGGLKVWKNEVYLSVPRWKSGVPVTLSVTSIYELSPLLEPFPSWEMQTLDNCSAFQFVLSMEIDPMGRMWVIDTGRRDLMTSDPKANCPAKLVILDLEDNNKVLMTYEFPDEVAHRETVLLNDLVLDHTDGGWAYITDTDFQDPGIIVFSLQVRDLWKIRDDTMKPQEIAYDLTVEGMKMTYRCPVNGIALSPIVGNEDRWVYYTSVASFEVHSIPTSFMKSRLSIVKELVRSHGRKSTQTDGMGMSAVGILYYGLLADNAVGMWDTKESPNKLNEQILVQDNQIIQWPVSFAFDFQGRLWFVTNRAYRFKMNSIDLNDINYRVFVADTETRSYQFYQNGSAPALPDISL